MYLWISVIFRTLPNAVGNVLAGVICQKYGSKTGLQLYAYFGLTTAVFGLLSVKPFDNHICLIISRFLNGIPAGLGATSADVYLSEMGSLKLRAKFGVSFNMFARLGLFVTMICGLTQVLGREGLWAWIMLIPVVFHVVQIPLNRYVLHTPAYLIQMGRRGEIKGLVKKLYGDEDEPMDIPEESDGKVTREESKGKRQKSN